MVDFGENVYFIVRKFTELRSVFKFLNTHHFDGVELPSIAMLGSIDVAVLSLSNTLH